MTSRVCHFYDMNKKYDPSFHVELLKAYMELGFTRAEIASKFGIGVTTLEHWRENHQEFGDMYNLSKKNYVANECEKAERNLVKKCCGFNYEETEVTTELTKAGKQKGGSRVKVSKKYTPPSLTAIKMLLYNKAPEEWSDKRSLDIDLTANEKQRAKIAQLFEEVEQEKDE